MKRNPKVFFLYDIMLTLWLIESYLVYVYTENSFGRESYIPTNALLYTIIHYSKMLILKRLKTLQHVSIIIQIIFRELVGPLLKSLNWKIFKNVKGR